MTPAIALASYTVLAAALFSLFWASSRRLDADSHRAMQRWIAGADGKDGAVDADRQWAESFVRWFDQAFAVRSVKLPLVGAIPLPSFARSVLVSFLSLLVLALVWASNIPGMGRAMAHSQMSPASQDMLLRLLLVYGGATLITNWIPDYLSLIESRLIIARMARADRWSRRLGWLLVDAGATLAISFFAIHLGMVLLLPLVTPAMDIEVGCLTPESYSLATTLELFVSGLRFEGPPGTLNYDATGIYIYSTFLTSLWVWIYLIGGFCLRVFVGFAPPSWTAAMKRQPLRAMGLMVVLVFSAAYWPSWLHRRAHSADVYVHHDDRHAEAAEVLASELEAAGLRVRTAAEVDAGLELELLAHADAVILLDASDAPLDAEASELYRMGECGERPWGSTMRVRMPGSELTPVWPYTDRYAHTQAWSPGDEVAAIVDWAWAATPILVSGQVRQCQVLMEHHDLAPAVCEDRQSGS